MYILIFFTAVPGLVLLLLATGPSRFRLAAGIGALFSAAYIYGISQFSPWIERLGVYGFLFWIGSFLLLAITLVAEIAATGSSRKPYSITCLAVALISNAIFAVLFALTAGLGVVRTGDGRTECARSTYDPTFDGSEIEVESVCVTKHIQSLQRCS